MRGLNFSPTRKESSMERKTRIERRIKLIIFINFVERNEISLKSLIKKHTRWRESAPSVNKWGTWKKIIWLFLKVDKWSKFMQFKLPLVHWSSHRRMLRERTLRYLKVHFWFIIFQLEFIFIHEPCIYLFLMFWLVY